MMPGLSRATLSSLPPNVRRPAVDPGNLERGIVHLGVGVFHRAHQAVYTDDAIQSGDLRWGTIGASLRAHDTRDALKPQNFLYTLAEAGQTGERLHVVGSVLDILVAPENPAALLDAMTLPSVNIVSLTSTEKGNCHDPASGALDEGRPDTLGDVIKNGTQKAVAMLGKQYA
jgi:fructuronate reductase